MLLWIVLAFVGALIALPVIVAVVGLRLPEVYAASGSVDVELSPEELWKELSDFEAHPRAGKMARKVERLPDVDGRPSWTEDLGQTVVTWTAVEWEPPHRMVCEARDSVVPMTARWETVIEAAAEGGGSRVRVSNRTVIAKGTWHVPQAGRSPVTGQRQPGGRRRVRRRAQSFHRRGGGKRCALLADDLHRVWGAQAWQDRVDVLNDLFRESFTRPGHMFACCTDDCGQHTGLTRDAAVHDPLGQCAVATKQWWIDSCRRVVAEINRTDGTLIDGPDPRDQVRLCVQGRKQACAGRGWHCKHDAVHDVRGGLCAECGDTVADSEAGYALAQVNLRSVVRQPGQRGFR
jgi:hypothetical protein